MKKYIYLAVFILFWATINFGQNVSDTAELDCNSIQLGLHSIIDPILQNLGCAEGGVYLNSSTLDCKTVRAAIRPVVNSFLEERGCTDYDPESSSSENSTTSVSS